MAEYALKTIVKGTKKGGTAYGRLPGTCGAAHRPLCFVSGLLHLLCGEQAAGSLYVLPARSPDGSDDTLAGKRIPESLHPPVVGTEIGRTGYLMKPYQVDAALQAVEQAGYGASEKGAANQAQTNMQDGESFMPASTIYSKLTRRCPPKS